MFSKIFIKLDYKERGFPNHGYEPKTYEETINIDSCELSKIIKQNKYESFMKNCISNLKEKIINHSIYGDCIDFDIIYFYKPKETKQCLQMNNLKK